MPLYWTTAILLTYLLGSIPFGKLIAKGVAQIDITKTGSGNIGATNVARELGRKWGFLTLILDLLKGFTPVVIFSFFAPGQGLDQEMGIGAVALSALLGHQFSLFLRFRGGKGVATAFGAFLAISPFCSLLAVAVFVVVVYVWDYISLGSISAAAGMPLFLFLLDSSMPFIICALLAAFFIWLKHHGNIQRLLTGKERRWRKQAPSPRPQEADPVPRLNRNG